MLASETYCRDLPRRRIARLVYSHSRHKELQNSPDRRDALSSVLYGTWEDIGITFAEGKGLEHTWLAWQSAIPLKAEMRGPVGFHIYPLTLLTFAESSRSGSINSSYW